MAEALALLHGLRILGDLRLLGAIVEEDSSSTISWGKGLGP